MSSTEVEAQRRGLPLRMLIGASVPLLIVGSLHYYLAKRLFTDAGIHGPWAVAGYLALFGLLLVVVMGFRFARGEHRTLAVVSAWVSHLWIGAFALLVALMPVLDLLRVLGGWVWPARFADRLAAGQLQAGIAVALVGVALLAGIASARGKAKIERVEVPIPGLPPAFDGYRIAQVSDIHIGQTLGKDFLARMVGQVNALQPDAIAITGDLIDGQVDALKDEVAPLSGLRAKDGAFFVTGNHEYYYDGFGWEDAVRRLGVTVLHNSHRLVQRGDAALALGGIPDHDGASFGAPTRMDRTFAGAPEAAPRVLLAHQPRSVRFTAGHRVALQLSGHTHGGQFFPWMLFIRFQQPVVSGLAKLGEGWVYTSRGTGYWGPPLRLGAPPEITELILRPA